MDFGHVEGDRLSSLPDDLIHKILSFIDIKHAIRTSALSSRWRYIWTTMPCLDFSSNDFHSLPKFSEFVTHVLSARNNQIKVHTVKLAFCGKASQAFVKRILDYAFAHNAQQLNLTLLDGKKNEIPRSLFNSQSLKHLTLTGYAYKDCIMTPPTWELPSLATLNLHSVTLYDDNTDNCVGLFSNCANLKNLTLKKCRVMGLNGFNITHPGLSSLTLEELEGGCKGVNVVTPQLKTLSIRYWDGILMISAPDLSSFYYKDGYGPLALSADFLQLEKVDICISGFSIDEEKAHEIVCLLQQICSVKSLTLNSEIIMTLSAFVELISLQPSPFANLKSLKIYPCYVAPDAETQPLQEVTMSTEVINYLLDSSPGATFTMVSHDEIRAVRNAKSARGLMKIQCDDELAVSQPLS